MKLVVFVVAAASMLLAQPGLSVLAQRATDSPLQITVTQLDVAVPAGLGKGKCTENNAIECANNTRAVEGINQATKTYGISRRGELVAGVALMAFESGSWEYNVNHFPGRTGQGTRAMLMYDNVYQYAKSIYPDRIPDFAQDAPDSGLFGNYTRNVILATVLVNEQTFGSAFWFLTANKKASKYHNNHRKLRDGVLDDFKEYCREAVGVGEGEEDRWKIWKQVDAGLQ